MRRRLTLIVLLCLLVAPTAAEAAPDPGRDPLVQRWLAVARAYRGASPPCLGGVDAVARDWRPDGDAWAYASAGSCWIVLRPTADPAPRGMDPTWVAHGEVHDHRSRVGSSPRLRPLVGPELADVPLRAGGRSPGLRSWRRAPGGVGAARAPATLRDERSCAEAALRQKKRPQSSSARARSATNETLSGPVARPVNAETATAGYRASARPGRRARPARKGRRDRPARRASRVPRARRARRALRDRPDRRVPPGRPAPPDRRVPPGRPAPPALRGLLGLPPQPDTSRSWVPLRPRTAPVPRRRPRRVPQARSSSAAEAC
jgi:hypothetical protein